LQEAFIAQAIRMGLYDGSIVNLDFHTVPHFGVSGGVKMYQNRRFKNAGIKKGVILRAEMTPRFSQDSI
jgi:hypothetical protein